MVDILIVGDLMIDRYWHCSVSGLSPEAPIPLLKLDRIEDKLGGAANVALNVQAISDLVDYGLDCQYLSPISIDVVPELQQVDCFRTSPPTAIKPTTKNRLVVNEPFQTIARWDEDVFWEEETSRSFLRYVEQKYPARVGLVSDYGLGAITRETMESIRKNSLFVVVDPKGNDVNKYVGLVDIITPNIKELNDLIPGDLDLRKKAHRLSDEVRATVVLKLAGDGVFVVERHNGVFAEAPYKTDCPVIDPTGAGDTFISALTVCLARAQGLRQSVRCANRLAGIGVTHKGCFIPDQASIDEAFRF